MFNKFASPSGAHRAASILFCALLAACGGGGGNASAPPAAGGNTPGAGSDNTASVVATPAPTDTSSSVPGVLSVTAERDYAVAGGDGVRLTLSGLVAGDVPEWTLQSNRPGVLERSSADSVLYVPPPAGSVTGDTSVIVTATVRQVATSVRLVVLANAVAAAEPPPPAPSPPPSPGAAPSAPGISLVAGNDGGSGWRNAVGTEARFAGPRGIVSDAQGNLYVAERWNSSIRKIAPDGTVTTLAGLLTPPSMSGVDGAGEAARFVRPEGIAIDMAGNLYVTDSYDHTIRKITPSGTVTTLAGKSGEAGNANGLGEAARFNNPAGIVADAAGNLYVADYNNMMIRRITPAGDVTTFAENDRSAPFGARLLSGPTGIGIDAIGNLYVTDNWIEYEYPAHKSAAVRKISPQGEVTTLAGVAGTESAITSIAFRDGTGIEARFHSPSALALDQSGNVYVTEDFSGSVRRITPSGEVTTVTRVGFNSPRGITVNPAGSVIVTDDIYQTIQAVAPNGDIAPVAGMRPNRGSRDGVATAALFDQPNSAASDSSGNLYVADRDNHTIRKISSLGEVTTFAGSPGQPGSADGAGTAARFDRPNDIAADAAGNLYVSHSAPYPGGMVRRITPAGVVTTLATDIPSSAIGADAAGNVYVLNDVRTAVWKIAPDRVRTVVSIFSADEINRNVRIEDMTVDAAGTVFVATYDGIRRITPSGVTLIGPQGDFTNTSTGAFHSTIAVDQEGNVYTSYGSINHPLGRVIRKTTQAGDVSAVFNLGEIGVRSGRFRVVGPKTLAVPAGGGIFLLNLP